MTAGVHVESRVSTFIKTIDDELSSSDLEEGTIPEFAHSVGAKSQIFPSDSGVVVAGEVAEIVVELPDEVVMTSDEASSAESES